MDKIELMRSLIEGTNGKIASITFVKKNGEIRKMQFRTGVKAGLVKDPRICSNGTSNTAAHIDYLIRVCDIAETKSEGKVAYRTINLSTITHFKCGDIEITAK